MTWENIGQYVLEAVAAIAVTLITGYLIPYIKSQITVKNFSVLKEKIAAAVQAAEQTIRGSKMGETRKAWVIGVLTAAGVIVDDMAEAMIEAAVKAMNDALDKTADAIGG